MHDTLRENAGGNEFAIASNASLADGDMLAQTVLSWLRVFGSRLVEVIIVVDDKPLSGRIADLHSGLQNKDKIHSVLRSLEVHDSRVKSKNLSDLPIDSIQERWFGSARPNRCHVGSPIIPFVAAIECVSTDIVLRCDSDMLFSEAGWLKSGLAGLKSGAVDLYEPPRIVMEDYISISSRAFMLSRNRFSKHLPLKHLYVDTARRIYRTLQGRPTFVALENMLDRAITQHEVSFRRDAAGGDIGWSIHGLKRSFASEAWFAKAVLSIERGVVPQLQRQTWNLNPEAWGGS